MRKQTLALASCSMGILFLCGSTCLAQSSLDPDQPTRQEEKAKRCLESTCRNVPLREKLTAIDLRTKYVRGIVGGFEQGAGIAGGVQLTSADAIAALELRTSVLTSSRKELLIYDPKIADTEMLRALSERIQKGVEIRVIGAVGRKSDLLKARPLMGLRLHTRTMIRDRREAFVGSQSLRQVELDSRREVGVIVREAKTVSGLIKVFESDWSMKEVSEKSQATSKELKKTLEGVVEKLSPLSPLVKEAVKEVVSKQGNAGLNPEEVKETVQKAVKEAVRERVAEMLNQAKEQ